MSKLTQREKRFVIFAIILISTVSAVYWGILPLWRDYERINRELVEAKKDFTQAETIVSKERTYVQKYNAYLKAYDELQSHYYVNIDENDGMIKFLALIEELVANSGVKIISKSPQGVGEENGYKNMKVNLTLKGSSTQLTELLLAFRESPLAINVDRLRIDLDQRNRLLQIKLIVSTLILEEEGDGDV